MKHWGPLAAASLLAVLPAHGRFSLGIDNFLSGTAQHGDSGTGGLATRSSWASIGTLDVRPYGKWELSDWTASMRLRGLGTLAGGPEVNAEAFVDEAWFGYKRDRFSGSVGIQNFQWGPAELLGASNALFPLDLRQKGQLSIIRGRALARLGLQVTSGWNLTGLVEFAKTQEPRTYATDWRPAALLKIEHRAKNHPNSFGAVIGTTADAGPYAGGFGSAAFGTAGSVYVDFREEITPRNYVPGFGAGNAPIMTARTQRFRTLGTAGARWEGNWIDARAEYVFNGGGYSRDDFLRGLASGDVARFGASGLELLGRHYAFASARWAHDAAARDWNLAVRYLVAVEDRSGSLSLVSDVTVSDNFVLYCEPTYFHGSADSEFGIGGVDLEILAGIKGSF